MSGSGYFGQFLLERGLITRDQLLEATALAESRNVRFGDTAIALGMLNAKIRDQVLTRQEGGKRFGEIAVEMGVLRPDEITKILDAQRQKNVAVGEAIVELGFLPRQQMMLLMRQFRIATETVAGVSEQLLHLEAEHRDFIRWTSRLLDQIASLRSAPSDCEVEEDSIHVWLEAHAFGWCEFHLIASRGVVSELAAAWTEGWLQTPELLDDVFREFLNTVVGKTLSSSPVGRRVVVEPPQSSPLVVLEGLITQPLVTPAGCILCGFARGRGSRKSAAIQEEQPTGEPVVEREGRVTLVVDASASDRRRTQDMLLELGFRRVLQAEDASSAVESVKVDPPSLVILDIDIPGGQPVEVLRSILLASPQTHVVMLTPVERSVEVSEALRNGASGYLNKPIDMGRLHEALSRLYLI